MAIDALADTAPSDPAPGRSTRVLACVCGATYRAAGRPDPDLLTPWVTAHSEHDDGLAARAEETFR